MRLIQISTLLSVERSSDSNWIMFRHHIKEQQEFQVNILGNIGQGDYQLNIPTGGIPQTKQLFYEIIEDIEVLTKVNFDLWTQGQIEETN